MYNTLSKTTNISDVFESLRSISSFSLREPTHIMISKDTAIQFVTEYTKLVEDDIDAILEYEGPNPRNPNIWDVGDYLGLIVVLSPIVGNGFKILEEITADTE